MGRFQAERRSIEICGGRAAITVSGPAVMTQCDQLAQNIIQLITIQIHGITDPNSRDA